MLIHCTPDSVADANEIFVLVSPGTIHVDVHDGVFSNLKIW